MKSALSQCVRKLDSELERFPWNQRRAYADWLAQTYYYVRHSTRLLAAAAARFPYDDRGNALHHRFAAHMAEEKKHELLAVHDLRALGHELSELAERPATRMFYEPQYYKVEHQDPLILFGYILPLEAMSVSKGPWVRARVVEAFGAKCDAFLKVHVEDDPDHVEKAFAALAGATSEQERLIADNFEQTAFAYGTILRAIAQDAVENATRNVGATP